MLTVTLDTGSTVQLVTLSVCACGAPLSKLSLPAEYVNFLSCVTPDNQDEYMAQMRRFNLGILGEADCPVFDGLFEYCQVSGGWLHLFWHCQQSDSGFVNTDLPWRLCQQCSSHAREEGRYLPELVRYYLSPYSCPFHDPHRSLAQHLAFAA